MAKGARLKVYQAPFGFHESVVAAPNQKAALAAWGAHQNLFALGEAAEAEDPAAIAAALAAPGTPLARPLGSDGAFLLDPERPDLPAAPRADRVGRRAGKGPRRAAAPAKAPPRPDRRPLDRAEQWLGSLEEQKAGALAELDRRRKALETEAAGRALQLDQRIAKARSELERARKAYRAAGGES
ncbi:MAG TPA: hypothetical protein VG248_10845 [Caulobacteraceae bacterium]|jgi:hypothetical protein|nr:hypothetical protein [Caulobacteraceae bacterium]